MDMLVNFLDIIPENVLTELDFEISTWGWGSKKFQNFLNRQRNIKKLAIHETSDINFDHLKLEHLKIYTCGNLTAVVKRQPELRHLDTAELMEDDAFAVICELKHLKTFRI